MYLVAQPTPERVSEHQNTFTGARDLLTEVRNRGLQQTKDNFPQFSEVRCDVL